MPIFYERPNNRRSSTIREIERKRNKNGKSKLVSPMGQHDKNNNSWPMEIIRGKDEVTGLGKPKKRGSKPNEPT